MSELGKPHEWRRAVDLRYVEKLGADPEGVGKQLGHGWWHRVYPLGNDLVIKIPQFKVRSSTARGLRKIEDEGLMRYYLPRNHLRTVVTTDESGFDYYMTQRKVLDFVNLTFNMLDDNEVIRAQFEDIVKANWLLVAHHGVTIDFFGHDGTLETLRGHPQLSNVGVEGIAGNNPVLLFRDTPLRIEHATFNGIPLTSRQSVMASRSIFRRNRFLLKHYTGYDIAPRDFTS